MPAFSSSLPSLTLIANDLDHRSREHPINRAVLLDIAPDRESLILSDKSTEELRHILKIRLPATDNGSHWLYHNRKSINTSVLDPTSRMSTYIHKDVRDSSKENVGQSSHIVRRRVLSASSASPLYPPMTSIENRLALAEGGLSLDIRSSIILSTDDRLISPRPLGPTHILIAHNTPPNAIPGLPTRNTEPSCKKNAMLFFHDALELPVNDLLFALNVPNLASTIPALPRRLFKELPRVLIFVPHLHTFPELVIYLHTKNQAELFRKLIPEWIRDIMHPLPMARPVVGTARSRAPICRTGRFFGLLVSGSGSDSSLNQGRSSLETERNLDFIAREIAQIACPSTLPEGAIDPLLHVVSHLDALRDNLIHIGYFGKDIWNELDTCHEILVRAVSWKAKIEGFTDTGN